MDRARTHSDHQGTRTIRALPDRGDQVAPTSWTGGSLPAPLNTKNKTPDDGVRSGDGEKDRDIFFSGEKDRVSMFYK